MEEARKTIKKLIIVGIVFSLISSAIITFAVFTLIDVSRVFVNCMEEHNNFWKCIQAKR